jgi:general secretion pathway protein K
MSAPHSTDQTQAGVALILVLWVLTLLTVMALGLTAAQRSETALTENQIDEARFRAVADAAIAYAMYSFLMPADALPEDLQVDPGDAPVWVPNGVPRPWGFGGMMVEIAVFNEQSRINLNVAPPELLGALLVALGVPEDEAGALADAIADWRDADDLRLLNGAEDGEYADAGRVVGAKDEPFTAVEELQQVLGIGPALYRVMRPALTVDSQGVRVDEAFASAPVLAAVQGISLEEAELLVQERDDPLLAGLEGPRAVNRGGPLYRIELRERSTGRGGRRMEALVELTPGQSPPYRTRWRRLGLSEPPPDVGAEPGAEDG